jgi:SulP family sulfate permease
LSLQRVGDLLPAAFAIAALAAIESLLSAKVADGMSDSARHDPHRELFGQGLANIVSPLFGGMPATGAIARTAVNVRAGARTRVSAIVHSLVLLVIVLAGSTLVAHIPLAALAGVLMVTAVRMVEPHNVRAVVRATRGDAVVLLVTAGVTIAFDLILAVEVGVAVAAVIALRSVAQSSYAEQRPVVDNDEIDSDQEHRLLHEHIIVYRIQGSLFFGAAQQFLTMLTDVGDARVVILRLADVRVLDATGAAALEETVAELEGRGITVLLKGVRPEHRPALEAVGAFRRLSGEQHVFDNLDDAVAHARSHVRRSLEKDAA